MSKNNVRSMAAELRGAAERPADERRESGVGVETARPDPEVVAKAKRRQFSAEYKRRILGEANAATEPGAIGAVLRREGLYSSHLTTWRQQLEAAAERGLAPRKRGRKSAANPLTEENRKLRHENARLERKLKQAELILEIQKKASEILGIPLRSLDSGEND
jgi:transposase-like protein